MGGKIPDKKILHYDNVTLTAAQSAAGVTNNIDVTGFDQASIYVEYDPAVAAEVITTGVEFSTDGTTWFPETDETVTSGVATQVAKTRAFTSVGGASQSLPVISIPVADRRMRVLVSDSVGTTGTVTINVRLTLIN